MFVNKHFTYLGRAYLREKKVLYCDTFGTFLFKDENGSRFSDLQ